MYQIKSTCVCCHNCEMECPMHAIAYVGTKYEIDQDKCVQCGRCEQVCHTCSAVEVPGAPAISHDRIVEECDVVVCGGGTGLIAAVRAAQQGKKVILVEKAKKLGGNTDYAHACFPVYTQWHKDAGYPDIREEAVEVFWERSGHKMEKEMVRSAITGCDTFFDWLCTFPETKNVYRLIPTGGIRAVGPFYTDAIVDFPHRMYDNLLCRDMAIGPGWGGTYIKYQMLKAIREQKLWVEIYTETKADHLLTDASGAVNGILCSDPGGEVLISAKAVILATGGLGASDQKAQKYFGFFDRTTPAHRFSVPTDTGDAIDMLQELGVEADPNRMYLTEFGPAHHPYSYALYRVLAHPSTIMINLNGKRWKMK